MTNKSAVRTVGTAICEALGIDAKRTVWLRIILDLNDFWVVEEAKHGPVS